VFKAFETQGVDAQYMTFDPVRSLLDRQESTEFKLRNAPLLSGAI
jgi:hypothetical protein